MALDTSILAAFSLGACLVCIYIVFLWSRRVQASARVRDQLVDATFEQEKYYRILELNEEARSQPLNPAKNPFYGEDAEDFGEPPSAIWDQHWMQELRDQFSKRPDPGTTDVKAWEKRKEKYEAFEQWSDREKKIYEERKKQIYMDARRAAEGRVPKSMDISVLGGGWSFLLEFSTVIVIIFAVVTLGILGTLQSQEISTILAAIAGYVLGKATGTLGQPSKEKPSGTKENSAGSASSSTQTSRDTA